MHVLKSDYLGSEAPRQQASQPQTVVVLDRVTRWNVYRRLQELGVSCECSGDRPLTVAIETPTDGLLVWSVVQSDTLARPALADHLERCWQQRSRR